MSVHKGGNRSGNFKAASEEGAAELEEEISAKEDEDEEFAAVLPRESLLQRRHAHYQLFQLTLQIHSRGSLTVICGDIRRGLLD